jgi:flagella basal body P-ring formation protein FlgA
MRFLLIVCVSAALWGGIVPAEDRVALPPVDQLQMDALSYVEAQASALTGTYTFHVVKPPTLPRTAVGAKFSFEPTRLSRKELGGTFFVTFKLQVDGRPMGLIRVDMEGKWTGKLLRCREALPRNSALSPGQFEPVSFEGNPPVGYLTEVPAGYRLRTPVAIGHLLVQPDLEIIPVVTAGDQVRREMVSGALVIEVETLARSGGAMGEKVRLEMPTSHKSIQAVVTGPGQARVQWAAN